MNVLHILNVFMYSVRVYKVELYVQYIACVIVIVVGVTCACNVYGDFLFNCAIKYC